MAFSAPPSIPSFPPDARLFFLYGGDLGRLSAARRALLQRLLPPDERDANLVEVEPPAGRLLSLDQIAPTIMEELGTPAFFPDQRRVVVVSGLADLFGGAGGGGRGGRKKAAAAKAPKAAKGSRKTASAGGGIGRGGGSASGAATEAATAPSAASPSERFVAYLRGDFQQERNVLVVVAEEDDDKQRKVRDDDPLVAHLLGRAVHLAFREPPIRFEFEQSLYDRDAARAIALFRAWCSPDTRAAVFAAISHVVRIMLQVRVRDARPEFRRGAGGSAGGGDDAAARARLEELFPKGRSSLTSIHPFALRKAEQGARRYALGELVAAHAGLLDLNDAFFPPRGALFVPDLELTVEHYLLRLCAREPRA